MPEPIFSPEGLIDQVRDNKIQYIDLQFTDVGGMVKKITIPSTELGNALNKGMWFDGSSVEGFARIQESDMRLKIDPETYVVLPWSSPDYRRARVFSISTLPLANRSKATRAAR